MVIKMSKTIVIGVTAAALLPLGGLAASAAPAVRAAAPAPATYTADDFEQALPSLPLQLGGIAIGTGVLKDSNDSRIGEFYESCTVVTAKRDQKLLCTIDLRFRDGDISGLVVEGESLLVPGPSSRPATGSITGGAGTGYNAWRGDLTLSGGDNSGTLNIAVNPL